MPSTKAIIESGTPDDVCALIKRWIREEFRDETENASLVYGTHGYYRIVFEVDGVSYFFCVRKHQVPELRKKFKKLK